MIKYWSKDKIIRRRRENTKEAEEIYKKEQEEIQRERQRTGETEIAQKISQMVVSARHRSKLTQVELARKIRSQQSAIAKLESGTTNPTIRLLAKICFATNSKLDIFISKKKDIDKTK